MCHICSAYGMLFTFGKLLQRDNDFLGAENSLVLSGFCVWDGFCFQDISDEGDAFLDVAYLFGVE